MARRRAGARRGVRLDSRQSSPTEVPMRLIEFVILAGCLVLAPLPGGRPPAVLCRSSKRWLMLCRPAVLPLLVCAPFLALLSVAESAEDRMLDISIESAERALQQGRPAT